MIIPLIAKIKSGKRVGKYKLQYKMMSLSGYKIIRYSRPRSKIGKKAHWTLVLTGYFCDVQYITNKNLIWIESTNTCPCFQ